MCTTNTIRLSKSSYETHRQIFGSRTNSVLEQTGSWCWFINKQLPRVNPANEQRALGVHKTPIKWTTKQTQRLTEFRRISWGGLSSFSFRGVLVRLECSHYVQKIHWVHLSGLNGVCKCENTLTEKSTVIALISPCFSLCKDKHTYRFLLPFSLENPLLLTWPFTKWIMLAKVW